MGNTPLNVERDEITNVAAVFSATADVIAAQRQLVAACTFNGPMAGRKYTDSGTAVHGGYQKVATVLQKWQEQSTGLATSLRSAAGQYGAGDHAAATDLAVQH